MINGTHLVLYSRDAEADRAFLRDVLDLKHVEAGPDWLIFKLPPAEGGIHPTDGPTRSEIYFMCDDLDSTLASLAEKGVKVSDERTQTSWGILSSFMLPSGASVSVYQPRHATAHSLP
jgi:predicted enzyme related to lactoylglutathione lyase